MFPKIGRDFVHKEDLELLLNEILSLLDPTGLTPIDIGTAGALGRAKEYKDCLDNDKNGNDLYKDLIDLDSDEDQI